MLKRCRGGSMLELLIVMSIILLLMSLAFPTYMRALSKAEQTRSESQR